MQSTGDRPYVRKLFNNAEKQATYFDEYMNLADLIALDLKDADWADRIYSEQFEATDEFVAKRRIAAAARKNLGDEARARNYLQKMDAGISEPNDYIKLASTVNEIVGDEEWTRKLLQESENNASDRFTLLTIAGKVLGSLGDENWASKLYGQVADQCGDKFQFEQLFDIVERQGAGRKILETLHTTAENKLSSARDLVSLAESVVRRFGDEEWARSLYNKALEDPAVPQLKFDIAASVEKVLADRKLAGTIRNG